jgi:hypothetical protein
MAPEKIASYANDAMVLWISLCLGPERLIRLEEGQALLGLARFACAASR